MIDRRLAVLFPGIGYHCDKPLLYYPARLARSAGYEVMPVPYAGFPEKVRGDRDKLRASLELAWVQAEKMLANVAWADYDDILYPDGYKASTLRKKPQGTWGKQAKESDYYNVNDYDDPEDFYDDNYGDFDTYGDAEDYYDDYHE